MWWARCADKYVNGGGPKAAEKARILLKLMQFIGAVSGGKTVTQVALNYLMCKGMLRAQLCSDTIRAVICSQGKNDPVMSAIVCLCSWFDARIDGRACV